MLRKLKNIFLPPAIIIAILSISLSCDSPFTPNLGTKVDVEPPLVKVTSPVAGGYIKDTALFQGTATAYRSLKRVEYKILANKKERGTPWTEVRYLDNEPRNRKWYLDLPTRGLNGGDDGSITLQFRAIDDSQSGETVPFVYFIKNKPSDIILTRPSGDLTNANTTPELLYGTNITGQITDLKGLKPGFPQIKIWKEKLGSEPDRNDSYTLTDDELKDGLGWASLFLPGIGNRNAGYDDLEEVPPQYADRTKMAPVNTAQFMFRLDQFEIVPDPDNPDIRRIVYKTDDITGNRVSMEPGDLYLFRIRTSDTNTYDNEDDAATYKLPLAYGHPSYFLGTMIGHLPPLNFGEKSENPFIQRRDPIRLMISSEEIPPVIEIDNSDIDRDELDKKPNIYIDGPSVKKVAAVDPENPPATPPLFRLRIKGMHTAGINHAILKYTHDATGREGYLKWDDDDPDSKGYHYSPPAPPPSTDLEKAEGGHNGVEDPNDKQTSHFTFTAWPANQKDLKTGLPIFTTSSGPYILEATVYANGTNSDSTARYAVYMDGTGPVVTIEEIVGASTEPRQIAFGAQTDLDAFAKEAGGVIHGSPYTVNNNIQMVVTRFDESGIMQNLKPGSTATPITPAPARPPAEVINLPMVKWVVEVAPDNDDDGSDYFTRSDTVYYKLRTFRNTPTADNLEFFNEITDATAAQSPAEFGWVNPPKSSGKPADLRNNFKFNTNNAKFNGKDLWVYVIAQDTVQNLGFVMQKIHVDQGSDIPILNTEDLSEVNANQTPVTITGPNDLNVTFGSRSLNPNGNITWGGNYNNGFKNNVLEENQGIDLSFTDYDGIRRSDITIIITDLNGRKNAGGADLSATLTQVQVEQVLKDGNKNNWSGILNQQIMAAALYGNLPPAQRPNPLPVFLYDGMYKIEIRYKDDVNEKVVITAADRPGGVAQPGDNPPEASGGITFYFAVNGEPERPEIWVEIEENSKQSEEPVTVRGWVRSRLKVQQLYITFTPDIFTTSDTYNSSRTLEIPEMYPNDQYNTSQAILRADWLNHEELRDADGYYTYYWQVHNVVFQPPGVNYGVDQDNRRFTLEAYDRLGNMNTYTRTVLVDSTPPEVNIVFNYGRTGDVNGKVPFTVTASDNNKLADGKWWVLPATSPVPDWDTVFPAGNATLGGSPNGMGGWLYVDDDDPPGSGRFIKVINTLFITETVSGNFRLYVMFKDSAGNIGYAPGRGKAGPPPVLPAPDIEFKVDQSTDYPTINIDNLKPALDTFVRVKADIIISGGLASDDDGFNRNDTEKLPSSSAFDPPVIGGSGYVQIRFPATWDNNGTPTSWGQWITVPGALNPEGAIRFNFIVADLLNGADNDVFKNLSGEGYFDTDGLKHYQIKVTDEADAGLNDRPPGKNPDGVTAGAYPLYLPSVFKIFPGEGTTATYTGYDSTYYFVLDDKPPEIFFDVLDPTEGHPNYVPLIRPAYSSFALLAADLKGYVEENNFETLSISWDGDSRLIRTKNSPFKLENGKRVYDWNINVSDPATDPATAEIKALFEAKFNTAAQGLHTINLRATDTAGNDRSVAWMFYKDTQGPNIQVNTIRRVISHSPPVPDGTDFPADWPSDWPYGGNWKTSTDPQWITLRNTYGVANWSSEYAYYTGATVAEKAAKVIASLKAENAIDIIPDGKTVPVISGSEDQVSIGGSFTDDLSDIWFDTDNTIHYFWYRFDVTGRTTDPSVTTGWLRGNFEPMVPGNTRSADWKISIPPESTLADGEHTFDIKVQDQAGNWSDIYGLRFIVDRNDPKLLGYNDDGTAVSTTAAVPQSFRVNGGGAGNKPLPEEAQRVFSAAGTSAAPDATNAVFLLEGFVRDVNLSELFVVITSEGPNPYRVESRLDITGTALSVDTISGYTVVTPETDTVHRLTAVRTVTPNASEWSWSLRVLEKDIAALRSQTGSDDGTRRYITVTAIDKARRRDGPQRWNFYLDSQKPVIEYTNLEKGPNFSLNPGGANIILQGIASDDTRIQHVRYSLAKWDYTANSGAGAWKWATAAGWTLTAQPPVADWASMLDPGYNAANAVRSLNWTLNNQKLNDSGKYPQNIFLGEGQFKLDIYVTDFSLSIDPAKNGNPHNTTANPDPNYADAGYNPATNTGFASARKFFIDRTDPIITDKDKDKIYYRNDNSIFEFEAFDGNTITEITARIKDTSGNAIEIPAGLITYTRIGTTEWNYDVEIKPPMGTSPFDLDFGNYTLEITAKDGAGRETYATKAFVLDNEAPDLNFVSPSGGNETVTGRVVIRGNTTENSNLIKKVAFYIANRTHSFDPPTTNFKYTGNADTDFANGWHFYQDPTTRHQINYTNPPATGVLIFIEPGTFTWEIRIPNARNFFVSSQRDEYVQWTWKETTGETANLTYNGATIPENEDVGRMRLYIVAEDEAGNISMEERTFWLYPEGDRPTVSFSNPDDKKIEAERLMNGRIRVAGMARDNERVKYVWFRVLRTNPDGTPGTPYTDFKTTSILSWNTETWEVATAAELAAGVNVIDNRTPTTLTDEAGNALGGGWYRANGGGSPNVSWWTYINMEGELEPLVAGGSNKITIEARAEDTTRGDTDDWVPVTVKGMFSRDKGDPDATPPRPRPAINIGHTVTALVVQGAPIFDNEEVRVGRSNAPAGPTDPNPWGSITSYSLSKRASYRIVVKDDSGVGNIRWARTRWNGTALESIGMINLLDPGNEYNTTPTRPNSTYAQHLLAMDSNPTWNADTNPGIAVKAGPKPESLKEAGYVPAGTYLIWEPGTGYDSFLTEGPLSNVRYTTFTTTGFTLAGGGELIQRAADGNYEWLVTVDVNTEILDSGQYKYDPNNPDKATTSFRYPLTLSATDISKATPLTASNTSYLPIDNMPPKGSYTINTKPAGQAATVGGEAGDDGPVNGVAKVVIWFSRDPTYNGTNGISWHQNAIGGLPAVSGWNTNGETITVTRIKTTDPGKGDLTQESIKMPYIPAENETTGGDYAIVIDRNDPSGVQTKWGQRMPVVLSSGGMGKIWYAEINSFGMISGPVYIHYVVYDTAGNASYFKERLVIMNNAPKIARIKLGTDIRDNNTLRTGANVNLATGGLLENDATIPLNIIRTAVPAGTTDVQKGITDWISAIRTSESGAVRQIPDFTARNKLLALRVETTGAPAEKKSRSFRFEYVSGAKLLNNTNPATADKLTAIKAGRVYIIDDPGNARWGAVGAPEVASFTRGLAFMASLDGFDNEINRPRGELDAATGSVWELNSAYGGNRPTGNLALPDATYTGPASGQNTSAVNAEFVYKAGAFGTTRGNSIVDYNPAVALAQPNVDPSTTNTLFIIKIFDGDEGTQYKEEDQFADFALLSFRVNDNDKTIPSSQLYDLNPKTEGQEEKQSVQRSLSPMFVGDTPATNSNRTKGGLWNMDTTQVTLAKPGHIEPRKSTSLTSTEMGGARTLALNAVDQPYANPLAFYNVDTVSGRVVLRGYAEDDQRVNQIDLVFTDTVTAANTRTVTILNRGTADAEPGTASQSIPPTTGLLKVGPNSVELPTTDRVYYTDTIDLYQHRVEWAYIWDTETIPNNMVVGDVTVRAVVYNDNSSGANLASTAKVSVETRAPTTGTAGTRNNYNLIQINVRPYITGFLRNQSAFFHNTRSRQGWYPFSREEVAVVKGYNIGRAGLTTTLNLLNSNRQAVAHTANAATTAQVTSHGLTGTNAEFRYRAFTVNNTSAPGAVTMRVGTYDAVNNYTNGTTERSRLNAAGTAVDNNGRFWVQPWNTEYSPGAAGSDLWDDFTSVHIWQSTDVNNNTAAGENQGGFPTRRTGWDGTYLNPSMSMDPSNGALYASQGEGGAGSDNNTGTTMVSNNYSSWAGNPKTAVTPVAQFIDPIVYSDIYMLPSGSATVTPGTGQHGNAWVSQSLIGRAGAYQSWRNNAGVYISGLQGANAQLSSGLNQTNQYHAESTWYNVSTAAPNGPGPSTTNPLYPPTTDQFSNTHIIARVDGGNTHIHVSYYDTKDSSLKYRYNLRNNPGTVNGGGNGGSETSNAPYNDVPKMWTNLDGGLDADDTGATTFINNTISNLAGAGTNTTINANLRVVNYNTRNAIAVADRIAAGEHNAIALTSQGYPVVAYFDATNQRLKLAVSRRVAPVLAADWTIRDYLIPNDNLSRNAGEFVSIAIDTQNNLNRIHMAALDSVNKNLVYISGTLNVPAAAGGAFPADVLTNVTVRVVDHIGSVGRWCNMSLDVDGNPWIAYQDESYRGSMDGVRMAFLSTATFPKAMADAYGDSITGWETMNVPARYRVEDKRISIENFPARNYAPANATARDARFWKAAVAFPSPDYFRIAYYVK